MTPPAKILVIEDDPGISAGLQHVLGGEGCTVSLELRGDTGLKRAMQEAFDVVLTDLKLPGLNGLELVRQLHATLPRLPIILMTAHGTTESAIEAMKFGAYDYLLKPFEMAELVELVSKAATNSRLMTEPVVWGTESAGHDALVGNSRAMQSIYKEIGRVASRPINVLIRGETGTGKELIARAIYQHSDRAQAPFIAINCAAIPETLLESELFGHERGAFTGAESRRIGRFEQADQGTIFLDEIGDMTPGTQVKLLRVLQEKSLQRVGGKEMIPVDVRVIAATHRDLETAMAQKEFREDLFYRLSVVVIQLPPLRERREDIPELTRYFFRRHGRELGDASPSIHPDALQLLQNQSWPGNVRELENIVRKMLLLARGLTISVELACLALESSARTPRPAGGSLGEFVSELLDSAQRGEHQEAHGRLLAAAEQELFRQAIDLARGNQAKAARWLGISRVTMREKLTQFGIHPSQNSESQ